MIHLEIEDCTGSMARLSSKPGSATDQQGCVYGVCVCVLYVPCMCVCAVCVACTCKMNVLCVYCVYVWWVCCVLCVHGVHIRYCVCVVYVWHARCVCVCTCGVCVLWRVGGGTSLLLRTGLFMPWQEVQGKESYMGAKR